MCRFVSVDPLQHKYSYYTPYQYAGNKPITFIDIDGLEENSPLPESYFSESPKVDMTKCPYAGTNAFGYLRNQNWFWTQLLESNPEMFSSDNVYRINVLGTSPHVDDVWIKYNPTHAKYYDDVLVHHHIDQGGTAVGIPDKVHRKWSKALNTKTFGNNLYSFVFLLSMAHYASDIYSNNPASDLRIFENPSKTNELYYDFESKNYYEVTNYQETKNEDGNITRKVVTFVYYGSAAYNKDERRWYGINKLGTRTEVWDAKTDKVTEVNFN